MDEEMLVTDEPLLGDVDEMTLPELTDSVWMRLLANALDPDAPTVDDTLIPVDLPPDDVAEDDDVLGWADDLSDGDAAELTDDGAEPDTDHFGAGHDPDPHFGIPEQGLEHPGHDWHDPSSAGHWQTGDDTYADSE